MPYLCINIPSKIFYSAFGVENLKIARTKSISNEFKTSSKALPKRAQNHYNH